MSPGTRLGWMTGCSQTEVLWAQYPRSSSQSTPPGTDLEQSTLGNSLSVVNQHTLRKAPRYCQSLSCSIYDVSLYWKVSFAPLGGRSYLPHLTKEANWGSQRGWVTFPVLPEGDWRI